MKRLELEDSIEFRDYVMIMRKLKWPHDDVTVNSDEFCQENACNSFVDGLWMFKEALGTKNCFNVPI